MRRAIALGMPALLSIFLFEFLTAQIFFSIRHITFAFEALRFVHVIPAFVFAYVSDRHYRKAALLVSLLLGLLGTVMLHGLGFVPWVLFFSALVFNPMSISRAILLDNFPHQSPLKLMALAFLVGCIPWMGSIWLFGQEVDRSALLKITMALFFTNAFLVFFFFKDKKDDFYQTHAKQTSTIVEAVDRRVAYTMIAFILAEATVRMGWGFIHFEDQKLRGWIFLTNTALGIGTVSALLYKRLPHMSLITMTYVTGFCMIVVAIFGNVLGLMGYNREGFSNVIAYYCVVQGLNEPLFGDAVIRMFGAKRRAVGAAMIDLAVAVALGIAAIVVTFGSLSFYGLVLIALLLLLSASGIQKHVERRSPHL